MASDRCCRVVNRTAMMLISWTGSGDCGGDYSVQYSEHLEHCHVQETSLGALWHGALSWRKWPSEDGYNVVIKWYTASLVILRPTVALKRCSVGFKQTKVLTLPSECHWNWDSSDQATVFQCFIVQLLWACLNCSLGFLFLADRSCPPGVVFPSSAKFYMLCIQRSYSAYLCGHLSRRCLSNILNQSAHFLQHQLGTFIPTTITQWIFSLFLTILCKP